MPSFQLWNGRKCVWERSLLKNVERTAPPTSQIVGRLSMSDKSEIKLIAKCRGVTEKNLMTALRFYSMVSSIESLERLEHSHELVTSLSVQVFPEALQTEQKVGGCNIRLLQSHMRLKKNRPYNHWLKSQGHYLLCFSTSRTVGANSVRLRHETGTRYSLKATTKIPPTLEIKTSPYLGLEIPKIHERR